MPKPELLVDAKEHSDDTSRVEQVKSYSNARSDEHLVAKDVAWLERSDGTHLIGADEAGACYTDKVPHRERMVVVEFCCRAVGAIVIVVAVAVGLRDPYNRECQIDVCSERS